MPKTRSTLRILVTGSQGQIGWELVRALEAGDHTVLQAARPQLDLAETRSIREAVRAAKPNLIVNAGAYTAVDQAEDEPSLAEAVNATAVGVIGEEALRLGAAVLHFSTDYIFDGRKNSPYTPDDEPNPLSVYGRTKRHGEQALIASGAPFIILRTAWVYGLRRRNFLLAILRQALTKPELRIVCDQTGCPTWCRYIGWSAAHIINRAATCEDGQCHFDGREGVYHLASGGATTWHRFAQRVFELVEVSPPPRLAPISSADFGARAARPPYSVLDCDKTRKAFDVPLADWTVMLEEVLAGRSIHDLLADASLPEPLHESSQPFAKAPE